MKRLATIQCLFVMVATAMLLSGPVWGQEVRQLFFDDFSDGDAQDGSPVPWWWDATKGDVAAVDGDLWMRPTVRTPDLVALAPVDIHSGDLQRFSGDMAVTVQFTTTQSGGSSAGISVRSDITASSGYVGGLGTANQLFLVRLDGATSSTTPLGWHMLSNVDIGAEDMILQLSISDFLTTQGTRSSRIELRAWHPGEERPAQPQISATDSRYAEGAAAFYTDSGNSAPGIADATLRWIEFAGECPAPVVDFNGDGNVDIDDLLRMIENWGSGGSICDIAPSPGGDGVIDAADLEILMSYWGQALDDPYLLAHWKLDEAEGIVAYDSAAENDALVLGNVTWQPGGGQDGGALQFDGIDDYLAAPLTLNPAIDIFSVFAWIKGDVPGQTIVSQKDGGDWLVADTEGHLMTALKSTGRLSGNRLMSEALITDGYWHRVGLTWDGTHRILYVDDTEVAQDTVDGLEGSDLGLYIGAGNGLEAGSFWSGMIDEVRIHDRVVIP